MLKSSQLRGLRSLTLWPGALPLDSAGGSGPRIPLCIKHGTSQLYLGGCIYLHWFISRIQEVREAVREDVREAVYIESRKASMALTTDHLNIHTVHSYVPKTK